ncbi:MAG: transaldolase family protein [Hyphomicrobiaceae bacterium]
MKFFVDTADLKEIRELAETGLLDGVTTNPSLIAKSGGDFKATIKEICAIVEGPVSAEVGATEADAMIAEARSLPPSPRTWLPGGALTWDGLKACRALSEAEIPVSCHALLNANQALLAAKAGAMFISPFVGRLDDAGEDGMQVVRDIRTIYDNHLFETDPRRSSDQTRNDVKLAAIAGADVATVPPQIIRDLVKHPLTDKGLAAFLADWKKSGQSV